MASESSDENFLVIDGDRELARAYAAHVISVYSRYRWREYVVKTEAANKEPWQKLESRPVWQKSRVTSAKQKAEWQFWLNV